MWPVPSNNVTYVKNRKNGTLPKVKLALPCWVESTAVRDKGGCSQGLPLVYPVQKEENMFAPMAKRKKCNVSIVCDPLFGVTGKNDTA